MAENRGYLLKVAYLPIALFPLEAKNPSPRHIQDLLQKAARTTVLGKFKTSRPSKTEAALSSCRSACWSPPSWQSAGEAGGEQHPGLQLEGEEERRRQGSVDQSIRSAASSLPPQSQQPAPGWSAAGMPSPDFRQCTSAIYWFLSAFQHVFSRSGFRALKTQQKAELNRKAKLKNCARVTSEPK